jgi:hypothetical protein
MKPPWPVLAVLRDLKQEQSQLSILLQYQCIGEEHLVGCEHVAGSLGDGIGGLQKWIAYIFQARMAWASRECGRVSMLDSIYFSGLDS